MKNYGAVTDPKDITTKEYVDGGLSVKANIANPTFTGNVSGITKSMIGLSNVDNTSDLGKPISNPTQNALNLKADKSALSTVATSGNYVDLSNKPTSLPANGGTATAAFQFLESDTRSTNQTPAWYMANYGNRNIYEFKQNSVIGLSLSGVPLYSEVSTFVSWSDPSGGLPVQLATNDSGIYYRTSASTTAWGDWKKIADTSTPSGNSTIVSPSRPSSQNVGDTWYRVV